MAKKKELLTSLPSNPNDCLKINNAVEEILASLTRIADEKSFQKDVYDRMEEEVGIDRKVVKLIVSEREGGTASSKIEELSNAVEANDHLAELARKARTY